MYKVTKNTEYLHRLLGCIPITHWPNTIASIDDHTKRRSFAKRKMYFYYIEVTRPNGLGINNTYKIPSETNVNSFRPSLILKTSTFVLSYGKPFSFQVELVAKHSHANGTKKQRKIENGNELEQMKWLRFHHFNIIHVFVRHIWTEVFTVAHERWIIGKFWLLFRLCFVFVPISFSVFQSSSDVSGAIYFLCTN